MSSSTIQALVRPDVEYVGNDHAFLQPLIVTVYFSGSVPQHLVREQIEPIKISVSIAEEYNNFMAPVIRAKAWSVCQSEPSEPPAPLLVPPQYAGSDDFGMDAYPQDFTIPFLPLPRTFDFTDPRHWATLSQEIELWLVDEVQDSSLPYWTWGRDAFWFTFVGAHPRFPNGKWEVWDPRIPLEGTFIEEWLRGDETESMSYDVSSNSTDLDDHDNIDSITTSALDCRATLSFIWDAFSRHVTLFYPRPLISAT